MKTINAALAASLLALVPISVSAQQPQTLVVGLPANPNVLREGTEVQFRTLTELSSKTNRVGDRFDLEVTENVMLNGQVVIPNGSRGIGEVTRRVKKGMWGKSGKLDTRLVYVKVGDQQIRVRGTVGDRGKGGTAATVGAAVMIPVAGFFVTGTSAVLPIGTTAVGYLEADLPVVFAAPQVPTPLVVPATTTAPVTVPAAGEARTD